MYDGRQYKNLTPTLSRLYIILLLDYFIWKHENIISLTLCLMMILIAAGHRRPAIVPIPFEIPISILAYLGAMSKWFTLNPINVPKRYLRNSFPYMFSLLHLPEIANPLKATPQVSATVAARGVRALANTRKKVASIPKPPQLKIFLTLVVERMPFFRMWSARIPPRGTTIVINRWGKAPM